MILAWASPFNIFKNSNCFSLFDSPSYVYLANTKHSYNVGSMLAQYCMAHHFVFFRILFTRRTWTCLDFTIPVCSLTGGRTTGLPTSTSPTITLSRPRWKYCTLRRGVPGTNLTCPGSSTWWNRLNRTKGYLTGACHSRVNISEYLCWNFTMSLTILLDLTYWRGVRKSSCIVQIRYICEVNTWLSEYFHNFKYLARHSKWLHIVYYCFRFFLYTLTTP